MPPLSLLIKPASGSCNMRCRYCFYTDEAANRETACLGRMTSETMHQIVDRAFDWAEGECAFIFQGGEPTLIGLPFYRDLTDYVAAKPNPKKLRIRYVFQTNGLLIDKDWAAWFAEHQVLVGVSLDGPKEIHDRYRLDAAGKGTWNRVMNAIRILEAQGVDYNILTVVTNASGRRARQIYQFFQKNDLRWQQYIECLDPLGEERGISEFSLTPERYEVFLKDLFDSWYADMKAGRYVYNRYFENLMMILAGQGAESCTLRGHCGPQWVIEADGSAYPCDFYVLDDWKLGDVFTHSFEEMEGARRASGFVTKSLHIPEECKACSYYRLCRNGCRRNRAVGEDQTVGLNYFCPAYKGFLDYALPRLGEILRMLAAQARRTPH